MRDRDGNSLNIGDTVAFAGPFGNQVCVGKISAITGRADRVARYYGTHTSDGDKYAFWATVNLFTECVNSGKTVRKVGEAERVLLIKKAEQANEKMGS